MSSFSRREFLRRSGAALIGASGVGGPTGSAATPLASGIPALGDVPTAGRAFTRTPVYSAPEDTSEIVAHLVPDGVYPIALPTGDWYQTAKGFVHYRAVQPIQPYSRPNVIEQDGAWAELIAPVSSLREWCSAQAPILTRLGYGAVVYMIDHLTDDRGQLWYGLADQPGSELVGWSSGPHYASLTLSPLPAVPQRPSIRIDIEGHRLIAYDGDQPIGGAAMWGEPSQKGGEAQLRAIQPGGRLNSDMPLGLPWIMELAMGEALQRVHGAFWHNEFGKSRPDMLNNESIELPTAAARWLYSWITGYGKPVEVSILP